MANRMLAQGGKTPAELATYGFELSVSRKPTSAELAAILGFYRQELEHYQQDKQAAEQTIAAKPDTIKNAPELASWTMVANVLLNMDETISKE